MIEVLIEDELFAIHTRRSTYALGIFKGIPVHYSWTSSMRIQAGALNPPRSAQTPPYSVDDDPADKGWSSAHLRLECAAPLPGDLRQAAYEIQTPKGPVCHPRYTGYRVFKGLPSLEGLPSARAAAGEAETLELSLLDKLTGLRLVQSYTVFEDSEVIARSARLINEGSEQLDIERAASFALDLALDGDLDLISMDGAWARERQYSRQSLGHGLYSIGSRSGASGHASSPAAIVARPDTGEASGEAWSWVLVYSGSWALSFERGESEGLRVIGGIQPDGFGWKLGPGESFDTPQALLCYSAEGLDSLSQSWHGFLRGHILPKMWRDQERPILVNNWEATYFDFNEEKLGGLADFAASLGVELFALDDGWFGKRNSDTTSLGDWVENRDKLPGGLAGLAKRVRAGGMKFGLWLEPESLSPDSDLYRSHPDWCLHLTGRERAEGRNQLLLDMGRPEVVEEIGGRLKAILETCKPDYIKWDMNRHLALAGSASLPGARQGESRHRHMLGVYALMRNLTSAFPDILFEGCAGGGGRMDYGILAFMPQFWTSDNTDAFSRLGIQYGTSFFFPPLVMSAHVSAVPNHQTGRITALETRTAVAAGGNLGYELDPRSLPAEEAEAIRGDIAWYKERRNLLQLGSYHRILSPYAKSREGRSDAAWLIVSEDRKTAMLSFVRSACIANPYPIFLKLRGLEASLRYRVLPRNGGAEEEYSGSELMARGLELVPGLGDGFSFVADLVAKNP